MSRKILIGSLLLLSACKDTSATDGNSVPPTTLDQIPGHDPVTQDSTHKESPRLVPAESYLRTYLMIFGGKTALAAQTDLRASNTNIFDNWASYLGALGLPNYTLDLPRKGETNALMIATFERLGIALCDRAVEKDLQATPAVPVAQRLVFAFDVPPGLVNQAAFAQDFDLLHRTFLSYPAQLAPTDRTARFYKLYMDTAAKHDPKSSKFTSTQAGWAAVCYGLIRHPEFHLY